MPRERAGAARLPELVRGHWGTENKVHHARDQTMGEDASRVRKRSGPTTLATMRDVVLGILRTTGTTNRAARMRRFCAGPVKAIEAIRQT